MLYFDYRLQLWVKDGVIQDCHHPKTLRLVRTCCRAHELRGRRIETVPGHERKEAGR